MNQVKKIVYLDNACRKEEDKAELLLRRKSNRYRRVGRDASPTIAQRLLSAFKQIIQQVERENKVRPFDHELAPGHRIKIEIRLTPDLLEADLEWLTRHADELVGEGARAVYGLLGGTIPLEDIACGILLYDLCRNITFPFGSRPKSTLLALTKVSQAVQPAMICAKLNSLSTITSIRPPFIIPRRGESFGLVSTFQGRLIEYYECGVLHKEDEYEFLQKVMGFVLAPTGAMPANSMWKVVPDQLAAFAWG